MASISFEDFMAGAASPPAPQHSSRDSLPHAIKASATSLGIDPVDLATTIGYETAGTYDPWKKGPTTKWGTHRGFIQWGEPQAAQYGVAEDIPVDQQMQAVTQYLRDRGVQPGMGIEDIYSAINAGSVGRPNASDRPGFTVRRHVREMEAHRPQAAAMLASVGPASMSFEEFMDSTPAADAPPANPVPLVAQAGPQAPVSGAAPPPRWTLAEPCSPTSRISRARQAGHDAHSFGSGAQSNL
jgi:hypothetical protein